MIPETDKPLHQEADVEVTSDTLVEDQEFKNPEVEHVYMGIPDGETKEEERTKASQNKPS